MTEFRTQLAGFCLTVALLGAPAAAQATTSYNDAGLGNLTGLNPFNIIDNQSAALSVSLDETLDGQLVTKAVVNESLNGLPFTLTQHGSQTGDGSDWMAGFSFNLGVASYVQYVPSTPGETWIWTKGIPTLVGGTITPGSQLGATDLSHFAMLPAGKYTLLFSGSIVLPPGDPTFLLGTASAVPLPGAAGMFGLALLGLTGLARRRKLSV